MPIFWVHKRKIVTKSIENTPYDMQLDTKKVKKKIDQY